MSSVSLQFLPCRDYCSLGAHLLNPINRVAYMETSALSPIPTNTPSKYLNHKIYKITIAAFSHIFKR